MWAEIAYSVDRQRRVRYSNFTYRHEFWHGYKWAVAFSTRKTFSVDFLNGKA